MYLRMPANASGSPARHPDEVLHPAERRHLLGTIAHLVMDTGVMRRRLMDATDKRTRGWRNRPEIRYKLVRTVPPYGCPDTHKASRSAPPGFPLQADFRRAPLTPFAKERQCRWI